MAKPEKAPETPSNPNAWMVTFSDLLMLLLTFFVLLLTMSSLDAQKVREIARSGIHMTDTGAPGAAGEVVPQIVAVSAPAAFDPLGIETGAHSDTIEESLERAITRHHLSGNAWLERRPEGYVISVDGSVLFEDGSNALVEGAGLLVRDVAAVANAHEVNLGVAAFVDNPEARYRGDDHWHLAAARADSVVRVLLGVGFPDTRTRASAYGYAGGRDQLRFLQQNELLELTLLTGPANAIVPVTR